MIGIEADVFEGIMEETHEWLETSEALQSRMCAMSLDRDFGCSFYREGIASQSMLIRESTLAKDAAFKAFTEHKPVFFETVPTYRYRSLQYYPKQKPPSFDLIQDPAPAPPPGLW